MEHEEMSKASEANGKADSIFMVETRVVGGNTYEVVEGKVDWRGRPALRGRHGGLGNSFFILVNFGLENMATLSLAVNLMIYFLGVMHMNLEDSSNLLTNYMGTSYMIAMLISVFADVFIGRYMTVILSSVVELVGLLLLMLQACSDRLKPPPCDPREPLMCQRVHGGNEVHLYLALYLIVLVSGGIKRPCRRTAPTNSTPSTPRRSCRCPAASTTCYLASAPAAPSVSRCSCGSRTRKTRDGRRGSPPPRRHYGRTA